MPQTALDLRVGIIDPLRDDRASGSWLTVQFQPPFAENMAVVVIPMTQTYKGGETPGLRIRNVTHASFQIRFDEAVIVTCPSGNCSADGNHVNETVGWVAYAFMPR